MVQDGLQFLVGHLSLPFFRHAKGYTALNSFGPSRDRAAGGRNMVDVEHLSEQVLRNCLVAEALYGGTFSVCGWC